MTAISVSERLLEMAAFYTWLDFTLTQNLHESLQITKEKQRNIRGPLRCFLLKVEYCPICFQPNL